MHVQASAPGTLPNQQRRTRHPPPTLACKCQAGHIAITVDRTPGHAWG